MILRRLSARRQHRREGRGQSLAQGQEGTPGQELVGAPCAGVPMTLLQPPGQAGQRSAFLTFHSLIPLPKLPQSCSCQPQEGTQKCQLCLCPKHSPCPAHGQKVARARREKVPVSGTARILSWSQQWRGNKTKGFVSQSEGANKAQPLSLAWSPAGPSSFVLPEPGQRGLRSRVTAGISTGKERRGAGRADPERDQCSRAVPSPAARAGLRARQ